MQKAAAKLAQVPRSNVVMMSMEERSANDRSKPNRVKEIKSVQVGIKRYNCYKTNTVWKRRG